MDIFFHSRHSSTKSTTVAFPSSAPSQWASMHNKVPGSGSPGWHLMWEEWSIVAWHLIDITQRTRHLQRSRNTIQHIASLCLVQQRLFSAFVLHNHSVMSERTSKRCGSLAAGGSVAQRHTAEWHVAVWWALDNTEGVWHYLTVCSRPLQPIQEGRVERL